MKHRHWQTLVHVAFLVVTGGWLTELRAQMPMLDGQNMQLTLGESQVLQLPQPQQFYSGLPVLMALLLL